MKIFVGQYPVVMAGECTFYFKFYKIKKKIANLNVEISNNIYNKYKLIGIIK